MAKHKRPCNHKSKKQDPSKQHGKKVDTAQFQSQLELLGLKIIQVTSDGNCFFRALADQLDGDEQQHEKYRHMVVKYILKHREEFEPFIEDEVPFEEYCKSMEKDGAWAGNMELQAASLVTGNNVCIHRFMSPRWYIRNFDNHDATMIHLSYHDGEHYNSIRLKNDSSGKKAKPIVLEMDTHIAASRNIAKSATNKSRASFHENIRDARLVKLVMSRTGCNNYSKVEQVLSEVDGDTDAAVEYLIAEQGQNEIVSSNDNISESESRKQDQTELAYQDGKCDSNADSRNSEPSNQQFSQQDKKRSSKEMNNCRQETKRKQNMNKSVSNRALAASLSSKVGRTKVKKREGQNRRKEAERKALPDGCGKLPDVGALCI